MVGALSNRYLNAPGGVPTPLISNALGVTSDVMSGISEGMSLGVPMGRTATPEDIARAAIFLCSEDAAFITAQNLVVDGAESTGQKFSKQGLN